MFGYFFRKVARMVSSVHDFEAFLVWFGRFLYQSVLRFYPDVMYHWVLVYMHVCLWRFFLCSVFYWGRMPQSLWLVVGLMLILVVGSVYFGLLFLWLFYIVSVVFRLMRLCNKSCFLYLSIVTNLFHFLLNGFQFWSSLYLIHFISLFFMIFLGF